MSVLPAKDLGQPRIAADHIPWPQKSPASCPISAVKARLRTAGLRPTRQRMALGWLLFAKGDRHVSAEMLYEEAIRAREPLSLATVYNTLRQFSEAGLLRQVSVSGPKTFFDTNVSEHHHFYNEDDETVVDIPGSTIQVAGLPQAPEGMEISSVEVIVRLRRADGEEIETRMTGGRHA
ncbi:Fur family iron response transcriptional regulator [Bosea sp. BE125]|jgi:Fur family iron response transcriptional regulator|uniref:iron response transcriptional regulator IrrA n=1 Tax=unclassified Bosea (in: a-proteobacteria) TaxID=2653178 RepID=UPI00285B5423|nr:Fur family transcriptional regulator [Bosea sp. BE125]MDR6873519.1 Fur family iron response transcriptional regulator [Bosea sp. BE125]